MIQFGVETVGKDGEDQMVTFRFNARGGDMMEVDVLLDDVETTRTVAETQFETNTNWAVQNWSNLQPILIGMLRSARDFRVPPPEGL